MTELQTALVKLGYNTNGVDGRFGAGTQRAVISFQKDNGLEADGSCRYQNFGASL